jgi:PleD family two-component response regulator
MGAVAIRPHHSATRLDTARVLTADDQPHILAALEMLLHGNGFETRVVTDPSRVLPAMEAEQFDLVLMDLNYTRGIVAGTRGTGVGVADPGSR